MSIMVNGKAYDWGDITINLPGLSGLEPQEISYDDELEKEFVYGAGNKPRGYGTGNYKSEGKLSLLRDDYDIILDYCKSTGKPLYKIVIPKITVAYANEGGRTRIDVLSKVTFTKRSNKVAQGDKSLKVDMDFMIIGGIEADGTKAI